jgi:protoporphyrinogen oxidase
VESFGKKNLKTNSRITRVVHNQKRIQAIEVNGNKKIKVGQVVNTLPITVFLQMMSPAPPGEILHLAESLRYRNLIVVAVFLDLESISENASIYFPDPDVPFTRIYEPRNRSSSMSPKGKTSLVAEIPCYHGDTLWGMEDSELIRLIKLQLVRRLKIREENVIGAAVSRMEYAYPVIEAGVEKKIEKIDAYLKQFSNLSVSGRNGEFKYTHLHDVMKSGREIIEGKAR